MRFLGEMAGVDSAGNATAGSLQRLDLSAASIDDNGSMFFPYFKGSNLKSIVLGRMRYLQWNCFSNMPNLESFTIKGDLMHIDGTPFDGCPKLRTVDFEGNVLSTGSNDIANNCPELESVIFTNVLITYYTKVTNCPKFNGCTVHGSVVFSYSSSFLPAVRANAPSSVVSSLTASAMKFYAQNDSDMIFRYTGNNIFYNLACLQALSGKSGDKALKTLRIAVNSGYDNADGILKDNDFKSLRGSQEFNDIVALAKQVHITKSKLAVLKKSAPYVRTGQWGVPFTYAPATDANLQRVRSFFHLDSIAGNGDEISQMKNILYWLHNNIRHDGNGGFPKDCKRNSIDLFNACQAQGRGLNCRGLAIVLSEMYLSMGWPSRFLTCQPQAYKTDADCHVIDVVWSSQLGKWVWFDPTFAAYVTDENGLLLHPGEVRERMISDRPLNLNADANWNNKNK
jgi:hypothetical protein